MKAKQSELKRLIHKFEDNRLSSDDLKNQICAIQHQGYNAFPSVDGSLLACEHKCEQ